MLTNRDLRIITDELRRVPFFDKNRVDGYTVTFHYFQRTSSGGAVARNYDNAPFDAWADDVGFITVEQKLVVPCTYIPKVEAVNLVQEGYHQDSEVEILVQNKALFDHDIKVDEINNRFEFITLAIPHDAGLSGRAISTTIQAYDIRSVRRMSIENRLIAVVIGLSLRTSNTSKLTDLELTGV